jgi:S-formylglutathione hydrolase FrmB
MQKQGPRNQNEPRVREVGSPVSILGALWFAAIVLALVGTVEIRARILENAWLGTRPWALAFAGALVRAGEVTRASDVHRYIDALSARAKTDVVWLKTAPPVEAATAPRQASQLAAAEANPAASERTPLLPSAEEVHRLLLIGESSIQLQLGAELERHFRSFYRDLEVRRFGKLSTSLTRPDVLDWPAETRALLEEFHPDLVIGNFGGNDAQGMVLPNGGIAQYGTPEWDKEFALRVRAIVDLVKGHDAQLVMLGMPIMRDHFFSNRLVHINEIIEAATLGAGGIFISSWDLSTDAAGAYRTAAEVDGVTGLMRDTDGVHYTRLGGEYIARRVATRIERHVLLVPKDSALSVSFRREITSRALGRTVSYLTYVPQQSATEGKPLPVLFLLHGVDGSFADWPEHAHRELQRASSRHRLIIVTPEGGRNGWYLDSTRVANSRYETHLIEEVVPDVEAQFPVTNRRGIAGNSAGGHGALTLALKHPGVFQSVSSMSGVLDLTLANDRTALIERLGPYAESRLAWEENSAFQLLAKHREEARRVPLLITVGRSDRWTTVNRTFAGELEDLGIQHTFEEREGGHDWTYWVSEIPNHVAWHAARLGVP